MANYTHKPVMLAEVLEALQPKPGGRYVDGTIGGGNHAEAILRASGPDGRLYGCDQDALAVLRRERKQRVEAAEAYRAAGQEERAAAEEADIPVIDAYLPAAMSDAELEALVEAAIAETGATTVRDMGRVMGVVTQRGEGRADGRTASALVRSRLSA